MRRTEPITDDLRRDILTGWPAESLEQHAAVVDAMVAGDAARASDATQTHLASVISALRQWDARM